MKTKLTIFLFALTVHLATGQNLYQHPSEIYLGYRQEEMSLALGGGMAYEGIGRRLTLAELPAERLSKITLTNLPSNDLVDAYGMAQVYTKWPNVPYEKHLVEVGTDRFGNLSSALVNTWKNGQWSARSLVDFNRDAERDRNGNGVLDYRAGRRLVWEPGLVYHGGNLQVSGSFRLLDVERWQGAEGFDPEGFGEGQSTDANQKQWRFSSTYFIDSRPEKLLKFHALRTSDNHRRRIFGEEWTGDEKTTNLHLRYEQSLPFGAFHTGLHFTSGALDESLSDHAFETTDRRLRGFALYRTALSSRLMAKAVASLERGQSGWAFLPQAQLDFRMGKKYPAALSAYFLTGRRRVSPLASHLDWLAFFPELDWAQGPDEKSEKLGLSYGIKERGNKTHFKVSVDRTRFRDRAVLQKDEFGDGLLLKTNEGDIFRNTAEAMLYRLIHQNNYQRKWEASALYRFEFFDDKNLIPVHAAHTVQFRLRKKYDGLTVEGHYLFRSAQNTDVILEEETDGYHRFDLSANVLLSELSRKIKGLKKVELGFYWDNVFRNFNAKNGVEEAGFFNRRLLPDAPLWGDATTSNLRLKLRVGI